MSVRTGMSNPLARLREIASAGTSDFSLSGTSYFSDQHLQDILDSYRQDIFRIAFESRSTLDSGGTARYYDYYFEPGTYEEGTATFTVANATGGTVIPNVYDYSTGRVAFSADQAGTVYYLTARKYDLFAAAADVYSKKAAAVSLSYDFSADGHQMTRSQLKSNYTEMSELYASQALPMHAKMLRPDLA